MDFKENCPLTKKQNEDTFKIDSNLSSSSSDVSSQSSINMFENNKMTSNVTEYIPNGDPSHNLAFEEFPKVCCNCYDHHSGRGFNNCHTISSNINSIGAESVSEASIFQKNPFMSLENSHSSYDKNIQRYSHAPPNISSSFKKNVENEQFYFGNHPYYFSEHQQEAKELLPPISFFSPIHSINNSKYQSPNSSKNVNVYMNKDIDSFNYNTSSPDHNLLLDNSTNLISSQESAIIPSSNEWVSDDTITDSGSFARSSSFESPISKDFRHMKATTSQNVQVPSEEKICNRDIYQLSYEEFCDLKPFQSPKKTSDVPIVDGSENYFQRTSKSETQSRYFENPSKKNVGSLVFAPGYMHHNECPYEYGHQQRVFNLKSNNRVAVNYSDDCCVPQCSKEIEYANEIELNNEPSRYETCYQCSPTVPIKKEPVEPFLPDKEVSYSFKNFSKWCPERYFDMSL